MKIHQAYLKFKGQFIILVSGYSGSNKTALSIFLSKLFGFQHICLTSFYLPVSEYKNYIKINDKEILDWCNIYKSVDWNKFNIFVNKNKSNGLVITGFGFPTKLLNFDTDAHIYIKINKQKLLDNRESYTKKNNNEFDKNIEMDILLKEESIMTTIKKDSKINWEINSNNLTFEQIKDNSYAYLIKIIENRLKQKKTFVEPAETSIYRDFYYPNRNKNLLFAYNDQGIDYPKAYRNKHNKKYNIDISNSSTDSDSEIYLFTTKIN